MAELNRQPITVRLKPEDKEFFVQVTEESGLEPGIAARTILELMIKHLRDDPKLNKLPVMIVSRLELQPAAAEGSTDPFPSEALRISVAIDAEGTGAKP